MIMRITIMFGKGTTEQYILKVSGTWNHKRLFSVALMCYTFKFRSIFIQHCKSLSQKNFNVTLVTQSCRVKTNTNFISGIEIYFKLYSFSVFLAYRFSLRLLHGCPDHPLSRCNQICYALWRCGVCYIPSKSETKNRKGHELQVHKNTNK